jgi:hypothetical protein
LAKQFLDPYDNENYGKGEDPLVVDTLIAETNAGSVRWMNGLAEMPISSQRIKDGELSDYLLPLRGYSVDELKQMEDEKRMQREKREKEELERLHKEEQEQRVRHAAEAMIPAQFDFNSTSSSVEPDAAYFIIFNNTGDKIELPGVLRDSSFPTAATVNSVLFSQNSNATSLQEALIPVGTAPASSYVEKAAVAVEVAVAVAKPEKPIDIKEEPKRTLFGGAEVDDDTNGDGGDDDDNAFQDWATDTSYVHKFDAFDPYLDLPSYDEVGTDGKEIRLSQILADEVWEEELEAAKEKAAVLTYEEYMKRVGELKNAEESELLETREILQAPANARDTGAWLAKDLPDFEKYDQTKLDGMSQLFGLPPNELSEIPGYVEPPVPPAAFDSIAQLWDSSSIWSDPASKSRKATPSAGDEAFAGISALWGMDLADEAEVLSSTSATRRVVPVGEDGDSSSFRRTETAGDAGRSRLSQILADEVWTVEAEPPSIEQPFTYANYEKQVQEILEAEREELLETQAIMNARPGADVIEVPEKDRDSGLRAMNRTDTEDDLAVLEMDAPSNPSEVGPTTAKATDPELITNIVDIASDAEGDPVANERDETVTHAQILADEVWAVEADPPPIEQPFSSANYEKQVQEILEAEREELLETQAIMNARPGADVIEVLEKDSDSVLRVMARTNIEDDLAVLEMDASRDPSEVGPTSIKTTDSELVAEIVDIAADAKGDPVGDGRDETVTDSPSFSEFNGDGPINEAVGSPDLDPPPNV